MADSPQEMEEHGDKGWRGARPERSLTIEEEIGKRTGETVAYPVQKLKHMKVDVIFAEPECLYGN